MEEKIIKIITEVLELPEGTITVDTYIKDVEQWDSLAQVMIIGALEEELGVSIPVDVAVDLEGVQDYINVVNDMSGK